MGGESAVELSANAGHLEGARTLAEIDTKCSQLPYAFKDGSGVAARNRSMAGAAYKPLIEIPCSSHAGVKLHVHLELDMDLGRTSGWNIQDSQQYLFIETGGQNGYPRLLSAGEKQFLSIKLPNWNNRATWDGLSLVFNSITQGRGRKQQYAEAQVRLQAERIQRDAEAQALEAERAVKRAAREEERIAEITPKRITQEIGKMSRTARDKSSRETLEKWKTLVGSLNDAQHSDDVTDVKFQVGQGAAAKYNVSVVINYKNQATADRRLVADIASIKAKLAGSSFEAS